VDVGEADVVGAAVVVGEDPMLLEDDAGGLLSPPHPASNIDAVSGTAIRAAEVLFTALPASSSPTSRRLQR
jgi:hypothetical protein